MPSQNVLPPPACQCDPIAFCQQRTSVPRSTATTNVNAAREIKMSNIVQEKKPGVTNATGDP